MKRVLAAIAAAGTTVIASASLTHRRAESTDQMDSCTQCMPTSAAITWEQRRLALRAPGSRRKRGHGAVVRESTSCNAFVPPIHTTSRMGNGILSPGTRPPRSQQSQRRGVLAESSERKSSSSGMDLTNHIATPRTIAATMQWPPSPAPERREQQSRTRSEQACRESEPCSSPVRRYGLESLEGRDFLGRGSDRSARGSCRAWHSQTP